MNVQISESNNVNQSLESTKPIYNQDMKRINPGLIYYIKNSHCIPKSLTRNIVRLEWEGEKAKDLLILGLIGH